jgi:hypothetical protein
LNAYALLLGAKADRSGNPADLAAEHSIYDQAIAEAERDPRAKYAEAYLSRYCTCEGDEFDHVLAMYDRAIKLRPDYSWGFERRGDEFARKGDNARAIAEYDIATTGSAQPVGIGLSRHRLRKARRPRSRHPGLRSGRPAQPEKPGRVPMACREL